MIFPPPFSDKADRVTKPGSGQTQGNLVLEISFWWFSQGYVAMAFDPIGQGERLEYLGRNIGREQQLTKMISESDDDNVIYQNLCYTTRLAAVSNRRIIDLN
jgi:hypothetical protein